MQAILLLRRRRRRADLDTMLSFNCVQQAYFWSAIWYCGTKSELMLSELVIFEVILSASDVDRIRDVLLLI